MNTASELFGSPHLRDSLHSSSIQHALSDDLPQQYLEQTVLFCRLLREEFSCCSRVRYELSLSPKYPRFCVTLSTIDQVDEVDVDFCFEDLNRKE